MKTGTSKDMRDNWCIGYSDRYTVAVWVGNFEGDSMHDVSGVTGAAPAWAEIMQWLHEGRASRAPRVPDGVVAADVVFAPAVEPPRRGWFLAGTELTRVVALAKGPATARIASPANGATIALDPDIPQANQVVIIEGRGADASLDFYLDGRRLGTAERVRRWRPVPGEHRVELRTRDGRVRDAARFSVRGDATLFRNGPFPPLYREQRKRVASPLNRTDPALNNIEGATTCIVRSAPCSRSCCPRSPCPK